MEIDFQILTYILAVVILLLVGWIIRLEVRINRLLLGQGGRSLESSIHDIKAGLKDFNRYRQRLDVKIEDLDRKTSRSIRGVKTVRFNPFKGTGGGGNQSFATAFVSESGDGVVISSLYSRERVSVYSKPLSGFTSEYGLSEEEKSSIDQAKKGL